MKKRKLEMLLEQITGFEEPDITREQYSTPASLAARLLHFAYMKGDLEGKLVADLGCGTGILGIGAELLGARGIIGVDCDVDALRRAQGNARRMGCEKIDFVCCDIRGVCARVDTVVMNPPFGAQVKGSDRAFLRKAMEISRVIYSFHNKGSRQFVQNYIACGRITEVEEVKFPLARTFSFHSEKWKVIDVEMYRIETCKYHDGNNK
jgi:putative methylase